MGGDLPASLSFLQWLGQSFMHPCQGIARYLIAIEAPTRQKARQGWKGSKPACRPPLVPTPPFENPQATVQQSVASFDESVRQSGLDQRHEISRWSPNTSSLAPSTAGDSARGPSETERSVGASRGGSTIATHGSTMNNTMSNATVGNVEAARERTLSILELVDLLQCLKGMLRH
ncbi:hypothetical protein EMCG_09460 [[Emmonsia] crescens]|uniref:Uncharacterized protein n=1 Tax=[Emmonsia] crescens TaxID=73230 RepID=A0A0G2J9V3_9EURO|nr:hypothetical protein EMCG_09460 [Emmonsia crescens UAMH 3008]